MLSLQNSISHFRSLRDHFSPNLEKQKWYKKMHINFNFCLHSCMLDQERLGPKRNPRVCSFFFERKIPIETYVSLHGDNKEKCSSFRVEELLVAGAVPGEEDLQMDKAVALPSGW